jgi:5'-3' exonuclease
VDFLDDLIVLLKEFSGKPVILVDLMNCLYRSLFAFNKLFNSSGEQTGGYYGLTKLLMTISTSMFYRDSLVLLIDDGVPVDRNSQSSEYKSNRGHKVTFENKSYVVDCLIQSLPNVYRVYNSVVEADDLMFSISRIKQFDNKFVIYTLDKDLFQAIDSTTFISNHYSDGHFVLLDDASDYYKKHFRDLEPYQIPYYRACIGDTSDNLKPIQPRFPKKVAYYFAKYCVKENEIVKPQHINSTVLSKKQIDLLYDIFKSNSFMSNLLLMRLSFIDIIPVMKKDKSFFEILTILNHLELREYLEFLKVVL